MKEKIKVFILGLALAFAGIAFGVDQKKSDREKVKISNDSQKNDAMKSWQTFFQPPPDTQTRNVLAKKLKEWNGSKDLTKLLSRARNLFTLGKFVDSEATYQEILRINPKHLDALLETAKLYIKKREIERTFDYLDQVYTIINKTDDTPKIFLIRYKYILALGLLARNEHKKAHKILSNLVIADKTFTPAYSALAESYLRSEQLDAAEFITNRGIDRSDANSPELLNILGVIAQKRQYYQKARTYFNKALKFSPTYSPSLINRANQSIIKHEFQAAENDILKALLYQPDSIEAWVSLGILQKKTGRFDAAKSSFTKAINLNPESAFARYNLAVIMSDQFKRPNEALRLFHEVIQSRDFNTKLKNLAKIHIEGLRKHQLNQ